MTTWQSLNVDALKDIALYLNFDMIASPNPGYFTIDGDQSAEPDPNQAAPRIPEGVGRHRAHAGGLSQERREVP